MTAATETEGRETKIKTRVLAIVSFVVLVVDYLTLGNRLVTTNPTAQRLGGLVGLLALAGLVCGVVLLVGAGRQRSAAAPAEPGSEGAAAAPAAPSSERPRAVPAPRSRRLTARPEAGARRVPASRSRFRAAKVIVGLLVLASWLVGAPLYAYWARLVNVPGFEPGPWVADALLSVFAVAAQCAAPTPFALAFWPSTAMGIHLLLSRKDRPVLDVLLVIAAVGLAAGWWFIAIGGIQLGAR